MLNYRLLRTSIVCAIVIVFAGGCRVPVITSPSGDIIIDAGDSISFIAESYPNAIYKWTFDGAASDESGQAPTVRFDRAGVYDVTLFVLFDDLDSGFTSMKVKVNGPSFGEALVAKTGQTTSYRVGDDGDEQAGVSWPNPRFTDNGNGTVTDNFTGLIWLKQANYNSTAGGTGAATWDVAVDFCKSLGTGMCGLSDGSSPGDWRLPNVKELQSLIHYGYNDPALPNTAGTGQWTSGDPFTNVQSSYYWSATTHEYGTNNAWYVYMSDGVVTYRWKPNDNYIWPVRAGR